MRHAAAAHRAGRLTEAVAIYARLLQRFPFNAELHNNIGVALRGIQRRSLGARFAGRVIRSRRIAIPGLGVGSGLTTAAVSAAAAVPGHCPEQET